MKPRFGAVLAWFAVSLVASIAFRTVHAQRPANVMMPVPAMASVAVPQTTPPTSHSASLSWLAPTTCIDGSTCTPTGYNVYRAAVACPATGVPASSNKIATGITAVTYVDTTIGPGSWCYWVTAMNGAGESAPSNTAGGSIAQPLVNPPTGLTAVVK